MRHVPLLLVLAACGDPNRGTAVGNPGKLSMQVDGLPPGAELQSGSFDVAALELGSGRRLSVVKFDELFDLVDPGAVDFPAGAWDTAVLLPRGDDPLHLIGVGSDGSSFDVALPVDPLVFEGSFEVDGDDVVVNLSLEALPPVVFTDSEDTTGEPPEDPNATGRNDAAIVADLGVGGSVFLDAAGDRIYGSAAEAKSGGCSTAPLAWSPLGWLKRR